MPYSRTVFVGGLQVLYCSLPYYLKFGQFIKPGDSPSSDSSTPQALGSISQMRTPCCTVPSLSPTHPEPGFFDSFVGESDTYPRTSNKNERGKEGRNI